MRGPIGRRLLERRAKRRHRFLQTHRPALTLAQPPERGAEIGLRHSPLEWDLIARPFFQRSAKGCHRFLQKRRPTLTLAKRSKRGTEVVLRRRPIERYPVAGQQFERAAVESDCFSQRDVIAALPTFALH